MHSNACKLGAGQFSSREMKHSRPHTSRFEMGLCTSKHGVEAVYIRQFRCRYPPNALPFSLLKWNHLLLVVNTCSLPLALSSYESEACREGGSEVVSRVISCAFLREELWAYLLIGQEASYHEGVAGAWAFDLEGFENKLATTLWI